MQIIAAGTASEVLEKIQSQATKTYRLALNDALEFLDHGILSGADKLFNVGASREEILALRMEAVEEAATAFRAAHFENDPRD